MPAGVVNSISALATVDFYRLLPPSGYTKGLPAALRTDVGEGDIAPETRGKDFFPYKPRHLATAPPRPALARVTNIAQKVMSSGRYDGAIFTQGSPAVEETAYWLNLLIDTTLPICGNAAQRPQGQISNDGPKNIVDSLTFINSRIWADEQGRSRTGVVVIQEQQAFAAREVAKADARPGGYVATGGHGGILGGVNHVGKPVLMYVPAYKHTYLSEVNTSRLPAAVRGGARRQRRDRELRHRDQESCRRDPAGCDPVRVDRQGRRLFRRGFRRRSGARAAISPIWSITSCASAAWRAS